jgi:hypothetical protein
MTMADPSADTAAKERIIKHMNADHQNSLTYYLQHYGKLSHRSARCATLTDISLSAMTLQTTNGKKHKIPFSPPMKSWSDARTRTVEMDRVARSALDISPIRVTEFVGPSGLWVLVPVLFLLTLVVSWNADKIIPGTWLYDDLLKYFPGGPEVFKTVGSKAVVPAVLVHIVETWYLDTSRLRKYGVECGSGLWFKWIGTCLLEGFGAFQRIDAIVERKTLEANQGKH